MHSSQLPICRIILCISMAEFLLLLQIGAFYNGAAVNLLPLSLSTSSSDPSKSSQCCAPVFLVPISVSGNNVYITWWERNQTMNEPIMRVSNDNGKTFGEKIMFSEK